MIQYNTKTGKYVIHRNGETVGNFPSFAAALMHMRKNQWACLGLMPSSTS